MTLPNFLVIGAPKAGTTSLHLHLRAHPEVFMPELKEPRFFGYEGRGRAAEVPDPHPRGIRGALRRRDRRDRHRRGDAALPGLSERGRAHPRPSCPHARLIASLRDPVERSYSVYQMNRRNRGVNDGVPFVEAMRDRPQPARDLLPTCSRATSQLFPPGQLEVILLEDLEQSPAATMRRLYGFLGVDPGFRPDLSKIANPGGEPRSKLLHGLFSDPRLRRAEPRRSPSRWSSGSRAVRSRNLAEAAAARRGPRTAIGFFRDDILRTQDLIGRDLSAWLTPDGPLPARCTGATDAPLTLIEIDSIPGGSVDLNAGL